jgi:hypothetical protein
MVWHGRHLLVSALRKVVWQADQADEVLGFADVQVAAIVAVHGAPASPGAWCGPRALPSFRPGGCPTCCRHCRRGLGPSGSPGWPTGPGCGSVPPPDRLPRVGPGSATALARHHTIGCAVHLARSISGAPGALLSSDDFGSSVERQEGCHPVYGDEWEGAYRRWSVSRVLVGRVACADNEIGRDGRV